MHRYVLENCDIKIAIVSPLWFSYEPVLTYQVDQQYYNSSLVNLPNPTNSAITIAKYANMGLQTNI